VYVQNYIRALQTNGAPVGSAVLLAAAIEIVMSHDLALRAENGCHIALRAL